jgi:hypothetical protein
MANADSKKRFVRNWLSVDRIISLCMLAVGVIAIVISHYDAGAVGETISGKLEPLGPREVLVNGKKLSIPKGPIQIQFWTPSVRTKEAGNFNDWKKVESNQKLYEFGDKLKGSRIVKGYRWYEVTGAGEAPRMMGAWWVASTDEKFKGSSWIRVGKFGAASLRKLCMA